MGGMLNEETIELIKGILPDEWETKARELGAFERGRVVKTALDLLVLVLLYVTSGKSIGGTSSILKSSGDMAMNKNAVNERLAKSEAWVKWLAENISLNGGFISARPGWLAYRRVTVADATEESASDKGKTAYRLHYLADIVQSRHR